MRKPLKLRFASALATVWLAAMPGGAAAELGCTISLAIDDFAVSVGRIELTLGYPVGVTMVGHGAAVACSSTAEDFGGQPVSGAFFDDDAGLVSASLQAELGFPGFGGLAICNFRAETAPSADLFPIGVQSALAPAGAPIVPAPPVIVESIDCSDTPPTTTLDTTTSTVTTTSTTTTLDAGPACGDPDDSGGNPTATDSLYVLNVAVGLEICALQVCDVDSSGNITASDALRLLQIAVGLPIPLDCPD